MAGPNNDRHDGAPTHIHVEKKKAFNWLPWLLLGLGLLALLLALSRCNRHDVADTTDSTPVATTDSPPVAMASDGVIAKTPTAASSAALAGTSGLGAYLAGNAPAPARFVFEKLNFDTSKSDIRAADAAEVDQVAATLKQYPSAKISIAGYADARGADAANMALGKARADSIKSALVHKGIDAGRITTVSGGEHDPVDSNATATGRFENRRTELVVTAR